MTITDSIGKATATVVILLPYTTLFRSDGNPHTATITSITGVNSETGATVGTVDVSNTTHTNAGTYAMDYWFFTGMANYNDIGNMTITHSIGKATATVVVIPYTSLTTTYDGHPHTATATSIPCVTSETGATVGTVDVSHTTHTDAGTYAMDYWFFTGTANYNDIGNTTITDSINAVTLTASIIGDPTRPYDGNTNATLTSTNFSLTGLIGSESFSVTQTNGTYNSKDVATANTVTATLAAGDFTPAVGTLASNYMLPITASGAGHITAVTLTASIIGDPTRPYNGTMTAALTSANFSLTGLIGSESFTVTQTSGTYNSKDVVSANSVTATLAAADFTPTGGALATDYVLPSTASGAGHITTATLTASIIGDPTRPYNGNTNATLMSANFQPSGLASGESFTVTQTVGTYNSKDVAAANTVTASLSAAQFTAGASTSATNYVLPTTASGAGHITAVPVTASIINNPTRPHTGNTNATLTSANFSLSALVGMESFTVTQTSGTYNSKDVLTANTVTANLSSGDFAPGAGTLASNYVLPTTASGPRQITKTNATVLVTPYTTATTTYDGHPHTATVSITGVNGETGNTVGTADVSNTTHTNAGTYASDYWFFTGAANYNNIGNSTIEDSINKASLTITADNKTIILHAALPTF